MKSTQQELVWMGRTHFGDEPGIFSNANYTGLAFELPVTVQSQKGEEQDIFFILKTDFVKVFQGYKGHKVTISQFIPNTATPNQYDYLEVVLKEGYITESTTDKVIQVNIQGTKLYLSCKIEVDTTVTPGLYNDFLFTGLYFESANYEYYANLGFQ